MVDPVPDVAPLMPAPLLAVQLKVVPGVKLVKLIEVEVPEQIVWGEGDAVTNGIGFTDTVTVIGVPEHPFEEGVTE